MYVCYLVTNVVNGKRYVGITNQTITKRWNRHCSSARSGSPYMFHRAIMKHGVQSFSVGVIRGDMTKAEAVMCEIEMIQHHNTFFSNNVGYNMTLGGDGTSGHKQSEEMKRKLSKERKGIPRNPIHAESARAARRLHTKPNHTVPHSEETKEKLRQFSLGKKLSEETKLKMSEARRGRKLTEDQKTKRRGKIHSEETKRKMSESKRARDLAKLSTNKETTEDAS